MSTPTVAPLTRAEREYRTAALAVSDHATESDETVQCSLRRWEGHLAAGSARQLNVSEAEARGYRDGWLAEAARRGLAQVPAAEAWPVCRSCGHQASADHLQAAGERCPWCFTPTDPTQPARAAGELDQLELQWAVRKCLNDAKLRGEYEVLQGARLTSPAGLTELRVQLRNGTTYRVSVSPDPAI